MAVDPVDSVQYVPGFTELITVALGVYLPFVIWIMRETRSTVILTRRARKLRKQRGMADGGLYRSRAEETKLPFVQAMKISLVRPLGELRIANDLTKVFLCTEPIVTFFSLWIGMAVSPCSPCTLTAVGCFLRRNRKSTIYLRDFVQLQHLAGRPRLLFSSVRTQFGPSDTQRRRRCRISPQFRARTHL